MQIFAHLWVSWKLRGCGCVTRMRFRYPIPPVQKLLHEQSRFANDAIRPGNFGVPTIATGYPFDRFDILGVLRARSCD